MGWSLGAFGVSMFVESELGETRPYGLMKMCSRPQSHFCAADRLRYRTTVWKEI